MSTAASSYPHWGRAYKLTVYTTPDGSGPATEIVTSDAWEPEALHMTFEINQYAIPSPWWFADISVYNMNDQAVQNALLAAQWVTLEAGYQATGTQVIWDGAVMQVLYDREDVVNYRVTLHCLATDTKILNNQNFTIGAGGTQAQLVAYMAQQAKGYALTNKLPDQLSEKKYIRAKTVFGTVDKYFGQIAKDNNMQWFKTTKGTALGQLYPASLVPDYVYSPPLPDNWSGTPPSTTTSYTIIGSPVQNDSGVTFRVLLDNRLIVKLPPLLVKIDNAIIRQLTRSIPQGPYMGLAQDNVYVVAAVRHTGDTRGTMWDTEVTGYTPVYALNALKGIFITGQGAGA